MDLVDIISEKKFLGQEFLTWLWYKSEERGGKRRERRGNSPARDRRHTACL
jgi:hypothetical protein